jgi:hypothetical protein
VLRWAQGYSRAVVNVIACVQVFSVTISKTLANGKFSSTRWYVVLAYIQSGTNPASCFLCRILRGIQPRNSLHSTVILFVKSINTKGKKYQDWLEHSRAIIPTGSGDGSTAKQNPVRSPCTIGKLDDQFQF